MLPARELTEQKCVGFARPRAVQDGTTTESAWLLDSRWDGVPRLDLDAVIRRCPRVVLLAPHPDAGTLALGATLAYLRATDVDVTVVVIHSRDTEAAAALDARIGTPIDAHTLLLAPVECDGHADNDAGVNAVAHAAQSAARASGATLLQYPVSLWDSASPSDVPWSRLRNLAPPLVALQAKSRTLDHGLAAVPAWAGRVMETVLVPAADDLAARVDADVMDGRSFPEVSAPFDTMYDDGEDDPWRFDDSSYEIHRLDLVTACLGRRRYRRVLDIGCATGQLAERLRHRADAVTGVDASAAALDVARVRAPDVRWIVGAAPADLPGGTFDLIVLSEIAYFLDGPDLLRTLRAVRRALLPHGEIVLANWRHPTENIPLDGPTAHRQAAAMMDLPRRARYEDADLLIEVWGDPVSLHAESGRES